MPFGEIIAAAVVLVIILAIVVALISLIRAPRDRKAEALGLHSDPRGNVRRNPSTPPIHSMSTAEVPANVRRLSPQAPSTTSPVTFKTFTTADYTAAADERMGAPPQSPPILRLGEEGKKGGPNTGSDEHSITGKPIQRLTEYGVPITEQPARLSLTIDDGKATLKGSGIGIADFMVEEKAGAVDVVLTMSLKRGALTLLALMAFLLPSCTVGISPNGDKNVSVDGVQLYSVVKSVLADRAAKAAADRDDKAAKNVQP